MRKLKVLIADDIEIIAKTNQILVEKNNSVNVIGLAYNGQDEYDMIIELKPDIVITDNQMPKMNGVEVAEKIINSNLDSIPKFILVTGDYGLEFNKKCKEIGISNVVNKNNREIELPYTLEELIAEMELEEKIETKSLKNTGVTREEYNNLLDKFHKINLEFNF